MCGRFGEKEMIWYSHLTETEKIGSLSSVECQFRVSEFRISHLGFVVFFS